MAIRIDKKGGLRIPQEMLKELGLQPGDLVDVELKIPSGSINDQRKGITISPKSSSVKHIVEAINAASIKSADKGVLNPKIEKKGLIHVISFPDDEQSSTDLAAAVRRTREQRHNSL